MPSGIPSVALLRDTFRRAVKQALGNCEEVHPSHYRSRCRSVLSTAWADIGPNVQAVQVTESDFLIRGSWQYTIDLHTTDQLQIAKVQIDELASLLASAVPQGQAVKATFDFPPTEALAGGERLTCSFRGVGCGQVQSNMPCFT